MGKGDGEPREWQIKALARNFFKIRIKFIRRANWEFYVLLTSDQHWDNPKSDWMLQQKHLDEARERGAPVICCGDYFCCMQGRYDKRANKEALRLEHRVDNYFDALVDSAADFLSPYSKNLAVIGQGNHEHKILENHEIDLVDRLCTVLNVKTGSTVYPGGYSGIIHFMFQTAATEGCNRVHAEGISLRYEHGSGGGGAVTGDMIAQFRKIGVWPDIDIMISGHTHDSWIREFARKRINFIHGKISQDVQTHVKLPSYMDSFGDGFDSWEARRGLAPKPIGAYWLRFSYSKRFERVVYEILPAK